MEIKTYLNEQRRFIEDGLNRYMLDVNEPFSEHIEAMRYSLFAGGKRVRPILCLAVGEALGAGNELRENLRLVGCALECIHTYSLIHDDLPAMDDDELRRGKPTNHVVFGEAAAILAGDGLLTLAFDLLSNDQLTTLSSESRLKIIQLISRAAGPLGMVGGQALDIANENSEYPFETLQQIHKSKTGALITCSVQAGAVAAGATDDQFEQMTTYGNNIGLAFQIVDDLLNATSSTEQLGKAAGSDAERGKATYPSYFGIEKTRELAQEVVQRALDSIQGFDSRALPLRELATYIYTRSN